MIEDDSKILDQISKCKKIREEEKDYEGDPPHVMSAWAASMYEDIDILSTSEVQKDLKVGDAYISRYSGRVITRFERKYKKTITMPTKIDSIETEITVLVPEIKTYNDTHAVYTVLNPRRLRKCQWGWESDSFKPQVHDEEEQWIKATKEERKTWESISKEIKRIVPKTLEREVRHKVKVWRQATADECRDWEFTPEDERRVLYIVGILPDEEENIE